MFKSGSIAFSEFDITSQAWEPVDFDLLPSPEGYDQPLADQETMGIFESKQSNAPTSKIVSNSSLWKRDLWPVAGFD